MATAVAVPCPGSKCRGPYSVTAAVATAAKMTPVMRTDLDVVDAAYRGLSSYKISDDYID